MKPLEPNCLAYVTGGPDSGITVTCLQYCAPGFKYSPLVSSEVLETAEPAWIVQHPDSVTAIHAEHDLMRIDGSAEAEQEREVEHG